MKQPLGLKLGTLRRKITAAIEHHDKRSPFVTEARRIRTSLLCRELYGDPLPVVTVRRVRNVSAQPMLPGVP